MDASEFVQRWEGRSLTERSGSQSHFRDLCEMLGTPAPTDDRETDREYCYEARTEIRAARAAISEEEPHLFGEIVRSDGRGFCDVWKRGHFCWEYKQTGKHKTLDAALKQLKDYKDALDNPPLLVVCDIDHYEVHTNFTGYPATRFAFTIGEIANPTVETRRRLGGRTPLLGARFRMIHEPLR